MSTLYHNLPSLTDLVSRTAEESKTSQPQFGQFKRVDNVNFLDAHVTTTAGKPLSRKEKQQKSNQFCFIGLHHERYMIGIAVVNLKVLSNCFVYVYDTLENTAIEYNTLSPMAAGTRMSSAPNNGSIQFKQGSNRVSMNFQSNTIELLVKTAKINLTANITPSSQPMCLCTRTGYTGWVYMQKQTALPCSGMLQLSESNVSLTPDNCRAGIDWTLGYMTRETFWNWASINTLLPNKQSLGLNLVCGVNDTSHTENAVWLDDTLYNLPLTVFEYDSSHTTQDAIMKPWRIYSNTQLPTDRHVNLIFTPKGRRDDHTDVKLMASHFTQLIGTYSGSITLPNEVIELNDVWGLAEAHYAKW